MDTFEGEVLANTVRNWWAFVVRGILAILFGLAALVWPGVTLLALVVLFGAYALVEGIFAVIFGFSGRDRVRWWVVLWGLVSVAAGVLVFIWPGIGALALVYVIAAWAIVTGATEIAAAIALRKEITNEWALVAAGILSIAVGGILAILPGAGAISLVWLIGAYAIVLGILLLVVGFRLREWRSSLPRARHEAAPASGPAPNSEAPPLSEPASESVPTSEPAPPPE